MSHFLHNKKLFSQIFFVGCLLLLTCQCAQPGRKVISSGQEEISVQFQYRSSEAKTVCIAGSFNQWSAQADCMQREGDKWTTHLSLPRGRYSYVFVLDGTTRQADPGAVLDEDNGFGGKNSVLIVE